MSVCLIHKILFALGSLPRSLKRTPGPRLIMTLLVKNEEDMLERNLCFHKAMGIDGFIVTDNNSTDSTPTILQKYRDKGWILEVIRETATDYEQKTWVDRMIWKAKTRYGADWVINADADEFWYSHTGNLKNELSATRANVLDCTMCSVYPDDAHPWTEWNRTVRAVADYEAYGLSPYSIFERQNKKVIHRTAGYLQISMGNHKVRMFPERSRRSDITVYHYNIRGRKQFLEKMVNGGRQLEQHKGRHGGRHWRYFYTLYKQGQLDAEYDRVIGTSAYGRLLMEGYIRPDRTLPDFFKKMKP